MKKRVLFCIFLAMVMFLFSSKAQADETCWTRTSERDFEGKPCYDAKMRNRASLGYYGLLDQMNETMFVEFSRIIFGDRVGLGLSGQVGWGVASILQSHHNEHLMRYALLADLTVPPWYDTNSRLYFSLGGAVDDLGDGVMRGSAMGRIALRLTPISESVSPYWEVGVVGLYGRRSVAMALDYLGFPTTIESKMALNIAPSMTMELAW